MIGALSLVASLIASQTPEPEQRYVFHNRIEAPAYLRTPVLEQQSQAGRGFNFALGFVLPEMEPDLVDFHRSQLEQNGWHVEEQADGQMYAAHNNPETGCIEVFQLRIDGTTVIDAGLMRVANYTLYRSDNCPSFSVNSAGAP
jgi:hypothetical protein